MNTGPSTTVAGNASGLFVVIVSTVFDPVFVVTVLCSMVGAFFGAYLQSKEQELSTGDFIFWFASGLFTGVIFGMFAEANIPLKGAGAIMGFAISLGGTGTIMSLKKYDWNIAAWLAGVISKGGK